MHTRGFMWKSEVNIIGLPQSLSTLSFLFRGGLSGNPELTSLARLAKEKPQGCSSSSQSPRAPGLQTSTTTPGARLCKGEESKQETSN